MSKYSTSINYIDLESVGSTVTKEGMVFPIDIYEIPETASDAEQLMGVNVFETTDEWIENLSVDDLIELVNFLYASRLFFFRFKFSSPGESIYSL